MMIVDFDIATVLDLHFFSNNFNADVLPLLNIADAVSQSVKIKYSFGILDKHIYFLKKTSLLAVEPFQVLKSK